jgi:YHS domain-containing protein
MRMIAILFLSVFTLRAQATESTANLENGVVLKGYDPVSYFQGTPKKGVASLKAEADGISYLFANKENQQEFLKSPKKYAPAYEGWCATAVAGGYKYDIDPLNYVITDGRLFLFYKGWKGDAKKPWLKDQPQQMKKADSQWPQVRLTKE